MGWPGVRGRAAWVLAGGVLVTALALPAGPWPGGWLPTGPGPVRRPRGHAQDGDAQGTSGSGVIFQKCAVVSGQSPAQTAQVRLLVNNSQTPDAANLSDLVLLDNITGLTIGASPGNKTSAGFQAFRRKFLRVGDAFSVSYTAALEAGGVGSGVRLLLPALLSFESLSPSPNRTQLKALFTITAEEKIQVLPDHGLHAAGFFAAFAVSLVLAWVTLFFMGRYGWWKGGLLPGHQVQHREGKPEHSPFAAADGVNEDLALEDHMVDVLFSEDPGSMLQALEELEVAALTRADAELEACRTQISRDIIALLLRCLTGRGHLSAQGERRMGAAFRKQFLLLEKEVREELERKMVALTAECDLETRRKMETQQQREMLATEEAEELLKCVSERSAVECRASLRALHGLELGHLRRALALQKEEDFAKARRQLAVFQRSELHNIFFAQIKSAIFKGELKPEAAKMLLQDYRVVQEEVEELMDFFQANKRYHLSKRFDHRESLVRSLRSAEARVQGLLSAAAAQLSLLIQKHERAGYLDEGQTEALLERAQTEVLSVRQKLDSDLKQEKRRLRQKLIIRRRREMLQKHREQRKEKEQLSLGDAFRAAEDVGRYLGQWRSLAAGHAAALDELQGRLDQAALAGLRALSLPRSRGAAEELWRLQSATLAQELLRHGVPRLFLQQALEEHGRDAAARAGQLEAEESDGAPGAVQSGRQRLRDDGAEASTEEQAALRRWERGVFTRLCSAAFSLSEEELLRVRRDVHGSFAQMDRSLALPRVRARVLLRQLHAAWREAEFQKVDQAPAAPELQPQSKARKSRSKSKSKIDLLKKRLEDKIQLFDQPAPEDLVEKVRGELLRERRQQLEAQEGRFAESLVALQFQKAARMAKTLWAYTALLSVQDLLLEELSESETLTRSACVQILESHSNELQELERKLEDALGHQEAAQLQRALDRQQQWAGSGPGLLNEAEDADSERPVSAVLPRALSKSHRLLEQHQQSLREEQETSAVLEDLLENMETDTFATLYGQELRLASYLARLTMVPAGMLHRLLSVALPAASQPELLAMLDSVGQKHADHAEQGDSGGEQADPGGRRKHQGWWQALESRLRGELITRGREKMLWARRRKESILKKTCPPLRERVAFSREGQWPHLSLEPLGKPAAVPVVGAEAVDSLNTGEKLFIFRSPREPEISLHAPPRRKKKNFLNARKAAWASGAD